MRTCKSWRKIALLVLLLLLAQGVMVGALPTPDGKLDDRGDSGIRLAPQPVTVDQITHNKGNIVTTVDNYGYIGGYHYYGLPSGEYPRNSGHDYIGEIKYWMGAVTAAGDTLVANSVDDFQATPMPVGGVDDYRIYLSTDITRYFDYSLEDTVGLGDDNPAYGWRIWSGNLSDYVYNQNYDPLTSDYSPGGPTSLQESHYRFSDAAGGSPLMGLELTHTMLQWNLCYNEDFVFVKLEITNTSAVDYTDFAFGLYVDLDVGGFDGTGENGRLGDLIGFDQAENLAWTYDEDGYDPGWGPTVTTGFMGTKLLKTPQDLGMTAFRSGEWEELGDAADGMKYQLISSAQFDEQTVPRDLLYLQCTGGINLTAGSTVEVVYALVAGKSEADMRANASLAQDLFDNNYVGPQPPPTPTLITRPADGRNYLSWDNVAESGTDPMSGENDFAGYKLYRSDNLGKTWGAVNDENDNNCLRIDYHTIALYTVDTPGDPIPHNFVDTGLYNGVEYWYCLSAFDRGDSAAGVDALQSGFGIAGQTVNIVASTPRNNPAGFIEAAATVTHSYVGDEQPAEGQIIPIIFDESATLGAEYQVVFEDGSVSSSWHLINVTTGDTILADQTRIGGEPNLFEIAEGIRVVIYDAEHDPLGYGQTEFGGLDTTLAVSTFDGPVIVYWTGQEQHAFGSAQYRAVYELRYTTDSTEAISMWEGFDGVPYAHTQVPFEAWNLTTNQRVSLAMDEWPVDGVWAPGDGLIIVNYPYDPANDLTNLAFPLLFGWRLSFDSDAYAPVTGDVFEIEGAPLFGPGDVYSFKIDGVNSTAAMYRLKDIRVVPDPYFAQYSAMVETGEGESILEFQKIPDRCTIRIYTLAGDLVQTIDHNDGSGAARWNLQSEENIQVASGVYLFHVESSYGEYLGRFAVIK